MSERAGAVAAEGLGVIHRASERCSGPWGSVLLLVWVRGEE